MKKVFTLLCLMAICVPVALASNYYASRDGQVYEIGSSIPLLNNNSARLCNTFSFSYKFDKYYMVDDSKQPYTRNSLVGCEDWSSVNLFSPLIQINSDNTWGRLTADELRRANIRFVKLTSALGHLDLYNKDNDFNLDNIAYIDLNRMRTTSGSIGEVDLYLKPPKDDSYFTKQIVLHISTLTKKHADKMISD